MSLSYFSSQDLLTFYISISLLLSSLFCFQKNLKISLILLFIGTLVLGVFIANLDSFLILWDEQFHALVAKNLMSNPLKPTLYKEVILPYNYTNWTQNHIWLHKQPLFLWQIALSIKLFGTTAFAVRFPSIIMHAILPLFCYRIGSIIANKQTGYLAALFVAVAYFPLELVAGRFHTDHNDVAFLFYVIASFWAWFEYYQSKNKYWLITLGILSGAAVLTKWLMGLVVYVIWFITNALEKQSLVSKIRNLIPMLIAGLITVLVFLPWQLYAYFSYPEEFLHELALNARHFSEVIEGHSESMFYYLTDGFKLIYGSGTFVPFIFWGSFCFMIIVIKKRTYKVYILLFIVFIYTFYTCAATKMVSFPIITLPFIYLGLGFSINYLAQLKFPKINFTTWKVFTTILLPLGIGFMLLNYVKIKHNHTMWKPNDNNNRVVWLQSMEVIEIINNKLNKKHVIFNASHAPNAHVPIMFFTNNIAYSKIPTTADLSQAKKSNHPIAILNFGDLPDYIINDSTITKVDFLIKQKRSL